MSAVTNTERIVPRLRAAGLLLLLLVSLPFSLIGVLIMMAAYGIRSLLSNDNPLASPGPQQKTAIVTGQASPCEAKEPELLQFGLCMTGQAVGMPCYISWCLAPHVLHAFSQQLLIEGILTLYFFLMPLNADQDLRSQEGAAPSRCHLLTCMFHHIST